MKCTRFEQGILLLVLLFLAFLVGWTCRGWLGAAVQVETRRQLTAENRVLALSPPASEEKININTADAETLMTLPGIGERRAADILADREKNGPFRFPEDLSRVSGIGPETVERLLDQITTEDEP